jgi:hypothetical protein
VVSIFGTLLLLLRLAAHLDSLGLHLNGDAYGYHKHELHKYGGEVKRQDMDCRRVVQLMESMNP